MFLKSAHRLRGKTNLNDKLLPADWLEDLLQIKANSPLIGLLKGQLKLWLADTEGGREGEIKRMRSKSQSTVWELAGGVGGSVRKAFAKKGWGWCRGGVAIFSRCSGLPGDLCCCGDELLAVPDGLELLGNGALRLREGVRREVQLKFIFDMQDESGIFFILFLSTKLTKKDQKPTQQPVNLSFKYWWTSNGQLFLLTIRQI